MDTGGSRRIERTGQRSSAQYGWYAVPRDNAQVYAGQKIKTPAPAFESTAFWQVVQEQGTDQRVTDKTLQVVL